MPTVKSTITFRKFSDEDADKCIEIFRSNTPFYFSQADEIEFNRFIEDPASPFFVSLLKNAIVGCGGYSVIGKIGVLRWGMVDFERHKKGIGSKLLLYRLNQMINDPRIEEIRLETGMSNARFFERYGFKISGIDQIIEKNYRVRLQMSYTK